MLKDIAKHINILLELCKIKITSFVAVSTSVGYILYSNELSTRMILPVLGVFILSCGASSLNHYQERFTDALMVRTSGRPIPSGRISAKNVLIISILIILSSLIVIYFTTNIVSFLLSLLALFWYNFVYTPLKKKLAFAVIPGSLIGALPPMIGYTSADGSPLDYRILALALFFFIWQIPHFWLLLLLFGKDYEKANFPTLTRIFSEIQLSRITFVWIVSLAICSYFIFIPDHTYKTCSVIALITLSLWLIIETSFLLFKYTEKNFIKETFIRINLYVLAVVTIISIDRLLLIEK